ncbi:MAG TPA: glycosyltransferase family 87 protein [Gemmatirosa sp.]
MLRAYNHRRAQPGHDLYDVFFTEHTKFQYPPTALLPIDALPASLTSIGPPLQSGLTSALTWASRAAVVATALLTWMLLEIRLRAADTADLQPVDHDAADVTPHALGIKGGASMRLVLVGALALTYYPLLKGYALGQVQVMLDMGVAGALVLFSLGCERSAGAVLAACALVKPQYAIVLLWGVLRRRGRFTAVCATVLAVGVGLAVLRFGFEAQISYVSVLRELSRHGEAYWPNQSANGLVNRWFNTADARTFDEHGFPPYQTAVYAVTLVSSALFLGAALLGDLPARFRPQPRMSHDPQRVEHATEHAGFTDLLVVLAAATIASPIAWEHHYGVFLPLIIGVLPSLAADRPLGRMTLPFASLSYLAIACVVARPEWLFVTRLRGLAASHLFAGAVGTFVLLLAERTLLRATARLGKSVGVTRRDTRVQPLGVSTSAIVTRRP